VVPKAKHNQAIHIAGDEYCRRVVGFFDLHLAGIEPSAITPPRVLDPLEAAGDSGVMAPAGA
jgi:hypothetical protein